MSLDLDVDEFFFFFFKQKTAYEIKECDWSSDVCSSDLDGLKCQQVLDAVLKSAKERGWVKVDEM